MAEMLNPLLFDPTRTGFLRQQFQTQFNNKGDGIRKLLLVYLLNSHFTSQGDIKSLGNFVELLLAGRLVFDSLWYSRFISRAYAMGVLRSYDDMGQRQAGRPGFLRAVSVGPESTQHVTTLVDRTTQTIRAIPPLAAAKVVGVVADLAAQGATTQKIATEATSVIADLLNTKAVLTASSEVVRAFAEGQLDGMAALGVRHVNAEVEWVDRRDAKVCPRCKKLGRGPGGVPRVYTIAEARGLIPVHPFCRCCWRARRLTI